MKPDFKALLYGSLAVLSWSTVAVAFKKGLALTDVKSLVFYGVAVAWLVFAVIMVSTSRLGVLKSAPRRTLLKAALLGLLNPLVYYLMLLGGYSQLPAHIAQPLNYVWPILLTLLLSLKTRKRVPRDKYFGMAVSLAGVAAVSYAGAGEGTVTTVGILCVLGSAAIWAFYWMESATERLDNIVMLFVGFG